MLTNFVSVLGILLVAAFVVMGIYFLVERIGGLVAVKRWEKTHQSQSNYIPYNHVRPGSIPSSSYCVRCSREATLYDLNRRLTELEQFYTVDSDDESLVDMVKYLRHDVDNLTDKIKLYDNLIKYLNEKMNKNAGLTFCMDDIITNKSEEDSDASKLDA